MKLYLFLGLTAVSNKLENILPEDIMDLYCVLLWKFPKGKDSHEELL